MAIGARSLRAAVEFEKDCWLISAISLMTYPENLVQLIKIALKGIQLRAGIYGLRNNANSTLQYNATKIKKNIPKNIL
jgi:hypothetical protein